MSRWRAEGKAEVEEFLTRAGIEGARILVMPVTASAATMPVDPVEVLEGARRSRTVDLLRHPQPG